MRKGKIKITNELIAQALKFPPGWVIEKINLGQRFDESEMIISGWNFPEAISDRDVENVELVCYKENIHWDVKKV